MNNAHTVTPKVPAHRVVNRKGMLTGKYHFAHIFEMQELLEKEGFTIKKDIIQDFDKKFWNPETELGL